LRVAHFDCYNGISGDMALGAFLDLGVPLDELKRALEALHLPAFSLSARKVTRCGVTATQALVDCPHEHAHRTFADIRKLIDAADLPTRTRERAISCFRLLAEAEAEVHQVAVDNVHFHEVGALDSIIDTVGAMWCVDYLGIERFTASEIAVGSGTVRAAHGELPVPAPATALLLRGVPITGGGPRGELTTPTGAALLRALVSEFGCHWHLRIDRSGYGAGSREEKGHTNFLRVFLGEAEDPGLPLDEHSLAMVQTEIDDMSGEVFGYVQEKLFAAGALDVGFVPVQMKKNRPGVSIHVLVARDKVSSVLETLLRETTTFGARVIPCKRYCLPREIISIATAFGPVRIKIGFWGEEILKAAPEYEDCRAIAQAKGLPLTRVYAEAARSAVQWLESHGRTGSCDSDKPKEGRP